MYDLIIVGAGPAGYVAAERAGAAGLTTVLIEKNHLGGVCLNEGCVPSKTILHSARLYSQAKHSQAYGISVPDASFDLATVMTRKEKIVTALRKGVAATLKKNGVTVETGTGTILPKQGDAFRVQIDERIVEGKRLLIATGSEPVDLPIPGLDQEYVVTSREILSLDYIPDRLAVIGGGAIGLELAAFFAEVGSTVTVIELLPSIGGPIDAEIVKILQKELEKTGITLKTQAKVTAIGDHDVQFTSGESNERINADIILMSVGRRPVIHGFGLENLNLSIEKSAITTDTHGRTTIPGVWAAGDVNGKSMLAHTAYREAEVCINDMLGKKDHMRYTAVPGVIFTHPEVATVGLTLEEATASGHDAACYKLPLSYSGRYLAENERGRGICKIVTDRKRGTILGVHMIGGVCSEMIFGAALMIDKEIPVDAVKEVLFPHPTVCEVIKDTLWQIV